MWSIRRTVAAGAALALAGAAALAVDYGYGGSFNGLATAITEEVAAGDKDALKIQNWIEQPPVSLSKDFVTLSKIYLTLDKAKAEVLTAQEAADLWTGMLQLSADYEVRYALRAVELVNADPVKGAKAIAPTAKKMAKFGPKVADYATAGDLRNAAKWQAKIQKAYEKFLAKFGEPNPV